MNAILKPTSAARSTQEWQAADSAHYLHPFTDFKSLANKGSRRLDEARIVRKFAETAGSVLTPTSRDRLVDMILSVEILYLLAALPTSFQRS